MMAGRALFFCTIFFSLVITMGCESTPSIPPPIMFAPERLAVGPNPNDPSGQILYAGNPLTGITQMAGSAPSNSTITVIDLPAEAARAAPIVTGGILRDIAVNQQDGRRLFVTRRDGSGFGFLLVYDAAEGFTETARVSLPGVPGDMALSPLGNSIYVVTATTSTNALCVFSSVTFTQETLVPLNFTPTVLGVSPTGAILIGNPVSGSIEYFSDTSFLPISIAVGGQPAGLSFSPDGSIAYATVSPPPKVVAIDLAGTFSTSSTVPVNGIPGGIAAAVTTSSLVFIANANGTFSAVSFSTGSTMMSLTLGGIPRQIVLTQNGTRAYVSDSLGNSIAVIDTEKFLNVKIIR